MALEEIIDKIIRDAKEKASEIKNNADLEVRGILSKARTEAETLKKDILKENKKKIDTEVGRILVKANLERKNRLLRVRRSLIEECFKRAEEAFFNLDINILRGLFKDSILKSAKEGNEEIIVSERYKKILTDEFIKGINSEMIKNGKIGNLRLSNDLQKKELFILKGRTTEIDNSISAVLNSLKRDIESDIASILFCFAL